MLFFSIYMIQHIQSCILFNLDDDFSLPYTVHIHNMKKMPVFSFSTLRLQTNKQTLSS